LEAEALREAQIERVTILKVERSSCTIKVEGPVETPYYGNNFIFKITATEEYP